jgi:hypothetical protein
MSDGPCHGNDWIVSEQRSLQIAKMIPGLTKVFKFYILKMVGPAKFFRNVF